MGKIFLYLKSLYSKKVVEYRNTYIEYYDEEDKFNIKAVYDKDGSVIATDLKFLVKECEFAVYKNEKVTDYFDITVIDHDKGTIVHHNHDEKKYCIRFYTLGDNTYLRFNSTFVDLNMINILTKFVETIDVYGDYDNPDMLVYFTSQGGTIETRNNRFVTDSLCILPVEMQGIFSGVLIGEDIDGYMKFRYYSKSGNITSAPPFIEEYVEFGNYILVKGTKDNPDKGYTLINPNNADVTELTTYDLLFDACDKMCFAADRDSSTFEYINMETGEVVVSGVRLIKSFENTNVFGTHKRMAVFEDKNGNCKYMDEAGKIYNMPRSDEKIFLASLNDIVQEVAGDEYAFIVAGENSAIGRAKNYDWLSNEKYKI